MRSPEAPLLTFWLPGKIVPKLRPRFANGHAYLPPNYRAWKSKAQVALVRQLENSTVELPLPPAAVHIFLLGKHGKIDADNAAGSVLDALVGIVLTDDRLSCVPELLVRHEPTSDRVGVVVHLYQIRKKS